MTSPFNDRVRVVAARVLYALVLWIVISSTLEQFSGLNTYFRLVSEITFHLVVSAIALTCAIFEAVTLLGVSGLRNLWQRPDPIADIANRSNTYKAALDRDLIEVRKLAKKRYGYAFAIKELRRWHDLNPHCLCLMFSDAVLVGYVDAFPISAADYDRLLAEEPEELITPLRDKQVDPTCSFYIASVVVEEEWGAALYCLPSSERL